MNGGNDTYLTLGAPSTGQFRDRGSRFLAFAWPVLSEGEAKNKLNQLKKKYHDARHHCYAFRLDPESDFFRYSDDGEPTGTAGRPIYEQILSARLYETMIVVVRYFGGILLGTGGLHTAYKIAARDAIEHARIIEKIIEDRLVLTFGYEQINQVMQIINREHLSPLEQHFDTSCRIELRVRRNQTEKITSIFTSTGKIKVEKI